MQIKQCLQQAQTALGASSASPRLDAELLLAYCLDKKRSYLFTWPEQSLTAEQQQAFHVLLARRLQGEPIAYIVGYREFWGLELQVSPATLIPRPETELLVELALERIPPDAAYQVLDLGTGTGAIALALAKERPHAHIWAVDHSPDALRIAETNAQCHGLNTIQWLQSNWFTALPTSLSFDLIVANPPYIAEHDPHLSQGDVRFEPRSALSSGADGLEALRVISQTAPTYLKAPGWLLLEHGYDQGAAVCALLQQAGFHTVSCQPDLSGHDRVSLGQLF